MGAILGAEFANDLLNSAPNCPFTPVHLRRDALGHVYYMQQDWEDAAANLKKAVAL